MANKMPDFLKDEDHLIYSEFGVFLLSLDTSFIPKSEEKRMAFLEFMTGFFEFAYHLAQDSSEFCNVDFSVSKIRKKSILNEAKELLKNNS